MALRCAVFCRLLSCVFACAPLITAAVLATACTGSKELLKKRVEDVPVRGAQIEVSGTIKGQPIFIEGELLSVSEDHKGVIILPNEDAQYNLCPTLLWRPSIQNLDIRFLDQNYLDGKASVYTSAVLLSASAISNGFLGIVTLPLTLIASIPYLFKMNSDTPQGGRLKAHTKYRSEGILEMLSCDLGENRVKVADRNLLNPVSVGFSDFRVRGISKRFTFGLHPYYRNAKISDAVMPSVNEFGARLVAIVHANRDWSFYASFDWSFKNIENSIPECDDCYFAITNVSPFGFGFGLEYSIIRGATYDILAYSGLMDRSIYYYQSFGDGEIHDRRSSGIEMAEFGLKLRLGGVANGHTFNLATIQSGLLSSSYYSTLQLSWGVEL